MVGKSQNADVDAVRTLEDGKAEALRLIEAMQQKGIIIRGPATTRE